MKNVVITGVSTGIGLGMTAAFITRGYRVFGSVRNAEDKSRLQKQFGDAYVPLLLDVTDGDSIRAAVDETRAQLGEQPLHGLINNAGISHTGPLMHMPPELIRQQFEVNVFGLLAVTRAFLPLLIESRRRDASAGRVINMSSVGGQLSMPFIGGYAATKHAVEALSHALRRELTIYDIPVIIVGPGAVRTEIMGKQSTGLVGRYDDSNYRRGLTRFMDEAAKAMIGGYSVEEFAQQMVKIFETRRPKIRYAVVKGRIFNYIVPRRLPDRWMDAVVAKLLKFKRGSALDG